ncbi:mRNA decay activator protein ZFP36L2-like [Lineus longissimus]|uniref:mRNA decay activator protein ZFP36L2-like n=1 Tax=Lineus longissimus TaxID=88925 RepID=UPI002B4DCFF1
MSTALVSAFYDVGDVLCQNRKNIVGHVGKMSINYDRKVVGAPVNSFPRARGFSTSAIPSSPSSSGKISPASSMSSSGSIGSFTMPFNVNEMMMNRDLGLSKKIDRSMSVNDATDIRNRDNQRNNNINSSRYKTELCRPFEENGHCKYGDKCQFAHGMHELRNLARHPKYKTELCRTYHTVGFCPYGPRCHFIHNEDERKLNHINDLKQPAPMGPPMPCLQSILELQNLQRQQQQQNQCYQPSLPQQVSQRPRAIAYNQLSLSLGSTADSPPSSMSGSPTSSPTFFEDYRQQQQQQPTSNTVNAKFSTSIPSSAPPASGTVFNFTNISNELTTIYAPLDVQTTQQLGLSSSANHGVYIINQRNNNDSVYRDDVFNSPPSPPDSLSGDSVSSLPSSCGGSPRNTSAIRLPIFRRISVDDK